MRNNKANPLYNSNWYNSMEGYHIVLLFGITCASLAIGAYVLFGPNFVNRKKTPILGLQNLGQTCFMNTILQALGSCPIFIKWLNSQSDSVGEVGNALKAILLKLGQAAPKESSDYSIQPLELLNVLSQHGWQMNLYHNIQQDAHELMTFILSKVEDEIFLNVRNQRNGLSWLDREGGLNEDDTGTPPLSQSSVSLGACPSGDGGRRENLLRKKRSFSLRNTNTQTQCATPFRGRLVSQIRCAVCGHENPLKYDNFDSLSLHLPLKDNLGQSHTLQGLLEDFVNTEIINEFECEMCSKNSNTGDKTDEDVIQAGSPAWNSLEPSDTGGGSNALDSVAVIDHSNRTPESRHLSHTHGVDSSDPNTYDADPNTTSAGDSDPNTISADKSDPNTSSEVGTTRSCPELGAARIPSELGTHRFRVEVEGPRNLAQLDIPVISRASGISALSSNIPPVVPRRRVLCDAVRTLRIGKLPPCLCFHIHRTCYSSSGAYKRADYIDFPEYLVMDPYTYNSTLREREMKKQLVTRLNAAFPHDGMDSHSWSRASNVYRLKAVVVHSGSAEDGHFVTYRRGPLDSLSRHRSLPSTSISFESRWYFTSDAYIRESSLAQALKSAAYMLFYERCTPSLITNELSNGPAEGHEETTSSRPITNGHCIT